MPLPQSVTNEAEAAILKLLAYCQGNDWAGYDPYDALNSKLFSSVPGLDSKWPRIALTQALKHSPANFRGLVLIPKKQNPKGLGLFLSGLLNLSKIGATDHSDLIGQITERIIALRSVDVSDWCWGYSFPWQTRTHIVPAGTANLVCTTFVANALLDAYEQLRESRYLSMAASAAEYILNELYWTEGIAAAGFSYPLPGMRSNIHNANFMASALLCRVHRHTGEEKFLGPALAVARYSAGRQQADGSWPYGELPVQRWIDNFHTGYNLCALQSIGRYVETTEFDSCIRKGFDFYLGHFLREDGSVKYFHDRTYPIDIHCVAQSIITLLALKNIDPDGVERACSTFRWAMNHLWDDRGFFYYRVLRFYTIRTSYMRWSQAWMFLALSALLCETTTQPSEQRARTLSTASKAC